MSGILFIILCFLIGGSVTEHFLFRHTRENSGNQIWVFLPASFGIGTLLVTWVLYLTALLLATLGNNKNPLSAANIIVMSAAVIWLAMDFWLNKKNRQGQSRLILISQHTLFRKEVLFFGILGLFLLWIFFYVFQVRDGGLFSGFTVFSDYAPHTAMIRSFSRQNNFPTQYPHYGGQDVKYHFMFQFLTGNLEYLGLRIDWAYNLVSTFSLLGFFMLLYMLSGRIVGGSLAGGLAIIFFFFRSGFSFFRFAWEHIQQGDLLDTLIHNTAFIGYTMNENWGLWCFNVYLNQRHLGFGLLIVAIVLWIFMDWLEAGDNHNEKGLVWIKGRLFTREAWAARDLKTAVFAGFFLGLCAFWNGAAVIGGLLILAGFGLFSDGKTDYAVMAFLTILLSELQSKMFMTTSAVDPAFYWGLLAYDTSLAGVLWYMIQISGLYFLGCAFIAVFLNRRQRSILAAFLLPLFFAFTISLTPDISVNHKYVMISYGMITMFWAAALAAIWRKKHGAQILAVCLSLFLFATGIYDFVVVLKDNDRGHRIRVAMDSSLTEWLDENLDSSDLVLSPEYSINEVTMSGAMLYIGWPYYAWSAGYNTDYRADVALQIYTTSDTEKIKELVAKEKITYIIYESGMKIDEQECYEDVISVVYPMVYISDDDRIHIYQVR